MTPTRNWSGLTDQLLRFLMTAVFLYAAVMKLAAGPFEVASFARLGYPLWFMYVVGAAQFSGVVLLWARRGTAYGAVLLAVIMVGAIGSHLAAGDPIMSMLPASVLLLVLSGIACRHRGGLPRPFFGLRLTSRCEGPGAS